MKLMSVKYDPNYTEWRTIEYIPSNSRKILVYSPEFGTSIGKFIFTNNGYTFEDSLRSEEKINITHWKELPRYNGYTNSL